jgi:hypothetical protein
MMNMTGADGKAEQRVRYVRFGKSVTLDAFQPSEQLLDAGLDGYSWGVDSAQRAVLAASPGIPQTVVDQRRGDA